MYFLVVLGLSGIVWGQASGRRKQLSNNYEMSMTGKTLHSQEFEEVPCSYGHEKIKKRKD